MQHHNADETDEAKMIYMWEFEFVALRMFIFEQELKDMCGTIRL